MVVDLFVHPPCVATGWHSVTDGLASDFIDLIMNKCSSNRNLLRVKTQQMH